MKQRFLLPLLSPLALVLASCGTPAVGDSASPDPVALADAPFTVTELGKFNEPWAVAFLPGTDQALVTEKSGRLMLWQQGKANRVVAGAPKVDYGGQGGFGDVVLSPRFTSDGLVYLSWAEAGADDMRGAAVGRGKLVIGADGTAGIEGLSVIWRQTPKVKGRGHYSHRILFSPDGKQLFITSGDRQKMTPAQDMSGNLGKIVRLMPDGSVPADNPWAASGGVTSQIWSFGHRMCLACNSMPMAGYGIWSMVRRAVTSSISSSRAATMAGRWYQTAITMMAASYPATAPGQTLLPRRSAGTR